MKANKIIFFAALLTAASYLSAAPSFSGAIGGSAGADLTVPLNGKKTDGTIPLAGYGAIQANINEWAIFRGEIAAWSSNLSITDIFSASDANVRLNELSFVLQRKAFTATNYFSVFVGAFEPIGSDAFLMRHFGIKPIGSTLTKSYTSLAGTPLLDNDKGAGLSYIVNFDKAPIATGASFYFNKTKNDDWAINLDTRFALSTNLVTLDFMLGFGSPFQDSYKGKDVVLVIDTITMHSGLTFLAGSKYTHGFFLQFGLEDTVIKGDGASFEVDNIKFLMESRLKFKSFNFSLSLYNLGEKKVKELAYLRDPIGIGVTFYKDDIEGSRGDITLGLHTIASINSLAFGDLTSGKNLGNAVYDVLVTPYASFSLGGAASVETSAQIGVLDLTGSQALAFRITLGGRKTF